MIRLRFESRLAADPAQVWARAATLAGVNAELMPLLRMSEPAAFAGRSLEEAQPGVLLFHSWLLLFGLLPFDRHALRLTAVYPGAGFDEDSSSWLQRVWRHRRRVEAIAGGTRVVDELDIVPRAAPAFLVRAIVAALFAHRHRRLRRHYGALPG